jgi:hypothetical protein
VVGQRNDDNLIANGALAFAAFPEEWQKLRAQPLLAPMVVEEVLRYDSPVQATFRTTTHAVELHGTTIPADSKVALLWASANHDTAVFSAPERFDITRTPNQHVAFASPHPYASAPPRSPGSPLDHRDLRAPPAPPPSRSDSGAARVYNPLCVGSRAIHGVYATRTWYRVDSRLDKNTMEQAVENNTGRRDAMITRFGSLYAGHVDPIILACGSAGE